MAAPVVLKSRMTVVDSVYFQPPHEEATVTDCRFSCELESDEQPYQRQMKVGETWQPLDRGWLDSAAMLVVRNDEGRFTQEQPTREDRAKAAAKVVVLAFGDRPAVLVRPGRSARFEPNLLEEITLRCESGTARVTVTLIPE